MIVKQFSDGSYLEYADGNFDHLCVYMVNPSKNYRQPPLDVDGFLQERAREFGADKIYSDFVKFYNLTSKTVEESTLNFIEQLSHSEYKEQGLAFQKIFTILYMGMLAEENKAGTRLGKRIKRLGMHKLLKENQSVSEAANFMRGMNWRQIDTLCKERGF